MIKQSKKTLILTLLIGFIITFTYGLYMHIDAASYFYDSLEYYNGGKSFTGTGSFSLMNYNITYRGYFFPLLLCLYTSIGGLLHIPDWISILFANSLFLNVIIICVLPCIIPFNHNSNIFKRLIPLFLFLLYWQDLIYYPLSDFYGYGFILLCIYIMQNILSSRTRFNVLWGLLCGALLYITYNIRPIYLFVNIFCFLFLTIFYIKKNPGKLKLLFLISAICAGIFITSYPQMLVNKNQHDTNSIAVITDDLNGGEIFTSQLLMGFYYCRYESYVGDQNLYPTAPLNFIDSAGVQIISNERIDNFSSVWDYVKTVIKYPLDYAGIIVRHIASALYIPYNHVYIYNLNGPKTILSLLNYTILFLFFTFFIFKVKENTPPQLFSFVKKPRAILFLSSILPCLFILPGAIELRFFIPFYVPVYAIISLCNWAEVKPYILRYKWRLLLIYILVFMLLNSMWGSIMASAQFLPQLL